MQLESVNGVEMPTWAGISDAKLHLVDTPERFDAFYEVLMQQKLVACDTETSGFQWFKDHEMCGASFGWDKTHFYLPFRHKASVLGGVPGNQLDLTSVKARLQLFFNQTDVFTLWHNWKFDSHFYQREGIEILTPFHDTLTLWHFYDENAPGRLKVIASGWKDEMGKWHNGLVGKDAAAKENEIDKWRAAEATARRKIFTQAVKDKAEELACEPEYQGMNKTQLKKHVQLEVLHEHKYANATKESVDYSYIPIPLMCEYAGLDTFFTFVTYKHCIKEINWTKKLKSLYLNECKLSRALKRCEEHGVVIDAEHLKDSGIKFLAEEEELKKSIAGILGDTVNLNSPQQLATALINHGVTLTKETTAGNKSVDKSVLSKLADEYPVVGDILRLRLVKKLRNTYVESILGKLVDGNRLHCNFNQNVSTGRMSSSDPNLQNIPGSDNTIRKAFIPPSDDFVFVFADYSQIEVRLTAHYSQDPLLLDAYAKNQDIHTRTMCEVFGEFYDEAVKILGDPNHVRNKELENLRKVTKCVHGSTVLRRPDGSAFQIGSLPFSEPHTFIGHSPEDSQILGSNGQPTTIVDTYNSGTKELFNVITNRGTLTCSAEHQFVDDQGGLVPAGDLQVGTLLTEPVKCPLMPTVDTSPIVLWKSHKDCPETEVTGSPGLAYVCGMFMGDGSVSGGHSVSITHGSVDKVDLLGTPYSVWQSLIHEACAEAGLSPTDRLNNIYLGSRKVLSLFEALGVADPGRELDKNSQKSFRIPGWVWAGGSENLLSFLGGLFDTDGCVTVKSGMSLTTKSPVLAGHVCEALRSLGVSSFALELSYNKPYDKNYYRVRMNREDSLKFLSYMRNPGKVSRLKAYKPMVYRFPEKPHKVLGITKAGALPCVDISVSAEDHLYCSNGLLTHNTVNFGIIYGVGAPGLSTQIDQEKTGYGHLTPKQWERQCQTYIDDYLSKYLGVKRFINKASRAVKQFSQVENSFGRVRHLPHAKATRIYKDKSYFWLEARAQRQGVNFLVQGTAADMFKTAVVRVDEYLQGHKSYIVNFVHDEIQIYLHKSELHLLKGIRERMEDFNDYTVPIIAVFEWSTSNWADKKKLRS